MSAKQLAPLLLVLALVTVGTSALSPQLARLKQQVDGSSFLEERALAEQNSLERFQSFLDEELEEEEEYGGEYQDQEYGYGAEDPEEEEEEPVEEEEPEPEEEDAPEPVKEEDDEEEYGDRIDDDEGWEEEEKKPSTAAELTSGESVPTDMFGNPVEGKKNIPQEEIVEPQTPGAGPDEVLEHLSDAYSNQQEEEEKNVEEPTTVVAQDPVEGEPEPEPVVEQPEDSQPEVVTSFLEESEERLPQSELVTEHHTYAFSGSDAEQRAAELVNSVMPKKVAGEDVLKEATIIGETHNEGGDAFKVMEQLESNPILVQQKSRMVRKKSRHTARQKDAFFEHESETLKAVPQFKDSFLKAEESRFQRRNRKRRAGGMALIEMQEEPESQSEKVSVEGASEDCPHDGDSEEEAQKRGDCSKAVEAQKQQGTDPANAGVTPNVQTKEHSEVASNAACLLEVSGDGESSACPKDDNPEDAKKRGDCEAAKQAEEEANGPDGKGNLGKGCVVVAVQEADQN